jgi:hypothetical protein
VDLASQAAGDPVSYMLIEPTAPGWKPSPNSPTAAGCVCTSPGPWLLAQTARAHDLAAGQAQAKLVLRID